MQFRLIQALRVTWEDTVSSFTAENADDLLELLLDHLYGKTWGSRAVSFEVGSHDCWCLVGFIYACEDPTVLKSQTPHYWEIAEQTVASLESAHDAHQRQLKQCEMLCGVLTEAGKAHQEQGGLP